MSFWGKRHIFRGELFLSGSVIQKCKILNYLLYKQEPLAISKAYSSENMYLNINANVEKSMNDSKSLMQAI